MLLAQFPVVLVGAQFFTGSFAGGSHQYGLPGDLRPVTSARKS